jgi:hypothetical protein
VRPAQRTGGLQPVFAVRIGLNPIVALENLETQRLKVFGNLV